MARAARPNRHRKNRGDTVSPREVERFAAMAESWWDPRGDFRPLHALNPTRIAFIRDHARDHFGLGKRKARPLRGLSLLDVGCGGGLLCEPMRRLGAAVTGIDASAESIGVARIHAEEAGLDIAYRRALPEDLADEGARYDIVLAMEVVEHVPDIDAFLEACCGLVAPGGAMFLSTINRTLKSLALAKIGAEYVLRLLPAGTHDWRKFVRPSELDSALRPHGVRVEEIRGVRYSPLNHAWTPSGDLDVNYLVFAVRTENGADGSVVAPG